MSFSVPDQIQALFLYGAGQRAINDWAAYIPSPMA